jgi:gamma-glutamylcyclotransferase (GGCT)/AIG2-like uncharacterized protein YtfP
MPLFAYGTFRDAAWRKAILGADYPARPATLAGWTRIASPTGYLSIAVSAFDVVAGLLIDLDEIGWKIADSWEEVPHYQRRDVTVRTADAIVVAAETYVFRGVNAGPLYETDDDRLAMLPREEVERAIEAFQPHMRSLR